jgi:hypothetical protein
MLHWLVNPTQRVLDQLESTEYRQPIEVLK